MSLHDRAVEKAHHTVSKAHGIRKLINAYHTFSVALAVLSLLRKQ